MFGRYGSYKDALVIPFNPPSIPELGTAAGFDFELRTTPASATTR
jgi:multidrug efflux pump